MRTAVPPLSLSAEPHRVCAPAGDRRAPGADSDRARVIYGRCSEGWLAVDMDAATAEMKAKFLAFLQDEDIRKEVRKLFGVEEKEREIAELKSLVKTQEAQIADQDKRLNELEQYSRRNCLSYTGIPEESAENPVQLAIDLAKTVGVKLDRTDLDRAHRVGRVGQGQKPRPLLVKYATYQRREQVWSARKVMRDAKPPRGSSLPENIMRDVYLQESLTRRNQEIMFAARELRRKKKLWAVWTDSCIMKVRVREGSPTVRITSMDDLLKAAGVDDGSQK